MLTSKLTVRSQTTIPRQVRNALHLRPGQTLVYEIDGDRVIVRGHPGGAASYAVLKGKGSGRAGADYNAARAGARADWEEHASREGGEA